jgi:ubiquinone/menaquinone biosynthesis C-methylase UbiE
MMTDFYTRLARYYDKLYETIDYKTNSLKLHNFIQQHKKSVGKDWLDVACGTGTHISHLMDKYNATGFDLSEAMLEIAREKCPTIEFIQGDMTDFNIDKKFDIITCLFGSIGYLTREEDLESAINAFSKHTNQGGVVIIEPMFTKETIRDGTIGLNCLDLPEIKIARAGWCQVEGNVAYLNFNFLISTRDSGVEYFVDPSPMSIFPRDFYLSIMEKSGFTTKFVEPGLMKEGLFIGVKK